MLQSTADALDASATTREAFERDSEAAAMLEKFADTWRRRAMSVVGHRIAGLERARSTRRGLERKTRNEEATIQELHQARQDAESALGASRDSVARLAGQIEWLENSDELEDDKRLRDQVEAEGRSATAARDALSRVASQLKETDRRLQERADRLHISLTAEDAAVHVLSPESTRMPERSLLMASADRSLSVGEQAFEVGPELEVGLHADDLLQVVAAWGEDERTTTARGDQAALLQTAHAPVAQAEKVAQSAEADAGRSARLADHAKALAAQAAEDARAASEDLIAAVRTWAVDLATGLGAPELDDEEAQHVPIEAAMVLSRIEEHAGQVFAHGQSTSADLRSQARAWRSEADAQAQAAVALRTEAEHLRDGELLALPRPPWASEADDERAFGAVLEWQDGARCHEGVQRAIETALASSGVLGATLSVDALVHADWRLDLRSPERSRNLTEYLTVDGDHDLADVALDVLRRIAVTDNADGGDDGTVMVGTDGTFRAGVLVGAPEVSPTPLGYIGARQRREAALHRAQELELEADELSGHEDQLRTQATQHDQHADEVVAAIGLYPRREALRAAEAIRAQRATDATERVTESDHDARQAAAMRRASRAAADGWASEARRLGLQPDVAVLEALIDQSRRASDGLRRAIDIVKDRIVPDVVQLIDEVASAASARRTSLDLERDARSAHHLHVQAQAKLSALLEDRGTDIQDAIDRLRDAKADLEAASTDVERHRAEISAAERDGAVAHERLSATRRELDAASADDEQHQRALRDVLAVTDVASAAGIEATSPIDTVKTALDGASTATSLQVNERYDQTRASLAGVWALDRAGEEHGLEVFALEHRGESFTPLAAAEASRSLAEEARTALQHAEDEALDGFVLGRLPQAIAVAWVELHDWVREVNRKLRTAAASSGLVVQVEAKRRDDLAEAVETTYALAVRRSDVDRTPEQALQLREALRTLIASSDAETMLGRVTEAVDVRGWVDVRHKIIRSDASERTWGSRTGLSGGERRLVVLAPMLAALAAAYDRLDPAGLRLIALDEVPAEVDERGREGLARLIGELDLDVVCTSYLWDGAPGAWDGLDAHDLEAGPDGTVVAFPMLIRGLEPLPDGLVP